MEPLRVIQHSCQESFSELSSLKIIISLPVMSFVRVLLSHWQAQLHSTYYTQSEMVIILFRTFNSKNCLNKEILLIYSYFYPCRWWNGCIEESQTGKWKRRLPYYSCSGNKDSEAASPQKYSQSQRNSHRQARCYWLQTCTFKLIWVLSMNIIQCYLGKI